MSDDRINDVYTLLQYFGSEKTSASHDDLIEKLDDLDRYWPNGKEHFTGLVNAIISTYLNKESSDDNQ